MSERHEQIPARTLAMELMRSCKACGNMGQQKAYQSHLPGVTNECYFVEFVCGKCAYTENEVKREGISKHGRRHVLTVTTVKELDRTLLHAPSASVSFPALDMEFEGGATSGKPRTLRSLIDGIIEDLSQHANMIASNQTAAESRAGLHQFLKQFAELKLPSGMPWTLEIRDPLNLSFVSIRGKLADDTALSVEDFVRSADEEQRHKVADGVVDEETPGVADIDDIATHLPRVPVSASGMLEEASSPAPAAAAATSGDPAAPAPAAVESTLPPLDDDVPDLVESKTLTQG